MAKNFYADSLDLSPAISAGRAGQTDRQTELPWLIRATSE